MTDTNYYSVQRGSVPRVPINGKLYYPQETAIVAPSKEEVLNLVERFAALAPPNPKSMTVTFRSADNTLANSPQHNTRGPARKHYWWGYYGFIAEYEDGAVYTLAEEERKSADESPVKRFVQIGGTQ